MCMKIFPEAGNSGSHMKPCQLAGESVSRKIFPEAGNSGSIMKLCQLAGQMEIDEADV